MTEKERYLELYGICSEANKLKGLLQNFEIPFEISATSEWFGSCFHGIYYPYQEKGWNSEINIGQNSKKLLDVYIEETKESFRDLTADDVFEIIREYHIKRTNEKIEETKKRLSFLEKDLIRLKTIKSIKTP